MRRLTTFLLVGALVGATATSALAQQGTTELRGSVTDETGGALPGVTVFIQNEADGTFREVITGGDGSYFAAQLLPGVFSVTAALPGFTTFQTTGYELRVGQTLPLNIILGVGALEETVTVSGQAPLVDLTSAEVGGTLDSQELVEMPLQNRSAFAAISLLPGIQFLPSESSGNDTIIANGQTAAASNLNVDGGYNGDSTSGGAGGSQVKVAIESVQEFQVVSGQFDAEFGRSSGAVINAVTKRGTNQWSGAGFSYSTSTNMTARNFFNAQQFAKDPDDPGQREADEQQVRVRRGVRRSDHPGQGALLRQSRAPAQQPGPVDDPAFPRRRPAQSELVVTGELACVEHHVPGGSSGQRQQLVGPAIHAGDEPGGQPDRQPDRDIERGQHGRRVHVRRQLHQRHRQQRRQHRAGHPHPRVLQRRPSRLVRHGRAHQSRRRDAERHARLRHEQLPGRRRPVGLGPRGLAVAVQQHHVVFLPDKMGDHDIKFGGTFHRSFIDDFAEHYLGGRFYFNTDMPFDVNDYSTYPERLQIRVGKQNGRQFAYPINTVEAFIQDKWTLNERWTLGLGARWDGEMLNAKLTDNPLMRPGTDPRDWNNISPRLSIAYDVTGDGRSVIRAGYGFFYDRTLFSGLDNVLQDPVFNDSFVASFPRGGETRADRKIPGRATTCRSRTPS